jgi:predicted dehydrogenase
MKLKVGLIGLGSAWEKRHRPALLGLSDRFEVRAIYEQVAHRAEKAAKKFNADTVDGYHALARRPDVDAVLILSPQWYGTLPIHAACDAGKAVYCAAAMDLTSDEAAEVKRRVEHAGIAFMVEFPRRLAPATLRLKELIATELGSPRLVFCHRRLSHNPRGHDPDTVMTRELIELVDWCHYVVGRPPKSVVANGRPSSLEYGGYRMMSVDFAVGAKGRGSPLAQISCGDYMPNDWLEATSYRLPTGMQVSCEHGVAFIDLPSTLVWFNEAGRHVESLESELSVGEQLLRQFHRAVTSLIRSTDDLDNAHLALKTMLASEESRVKGKRVELNCN